MEQLLDFSKPVDIGLLERTVNALNTSSDAGIRKQADHVLTLLKQSDNAWQSAGTILEQSQDITTRIFALSILEEAVKLRWKALPSEQRQGIRNYVVQKIVETTSVEGYKSNNLQRLFVNRLNLVLVEILKHEWPDNWPNFIPEIVGSSTKSEILCENNMHLLKLLSEEVFEFSKEEMKSEKAKQMKERLNGEFRQIFELCQLVLESSQRPGLITITLQTLLRFLAWIPLGYIFETPLIDKLISKFLRENLFKNETLACLTEIASIQETKYDTVFQNMFNGVMNIMQQQLPPSIDIQQAFETASERECLFIQNLSLFLSTFFTKHGDLLDKPENHGAAVTAMMYLVSISMVDDKEIFKICLEFWNKFAKDLYEFERTKGMGNNFFNANAGSLNLYSRPADHNRLARYEEVLSRVRQVMIAKMAKPEEVLVVEDEDGSIVRESQKDTDAIAQYKTMRDTLVYLTHLNVVDTEKIMLKELELQCESDAAFSWNRLNTLCWAIGSISGTMNEEPEKQFLVAVIRDLLSLCENKRGKDNKAVVASNIMYVVGQYPRFLKMHWKFLKTVVKKLFEFMHEKHPGVQDMACDTFLKISQKCKRQFVVLQRDEQHPYINELIAEIPMHTNDLSDHQRHTFYEAVGYMVREADLEQQRNILLENLMQPWSVEWKKLMQEGTVNTQNLLSLLSIQKLVDILRTNVRVCSAMGYAFRPHLMSFYLDMLHVYKFYSSTISQKVMERGEVVIQHKELKVMRVVKGEILKLIEVFISKAENNSDIANNFCPPLLDPILNDYQQCAIPARSPEVLELFVVVVNKLREEVNVAMDGRMVENILSPLFSSTLDMITANFTDWPDHRLNFFKLIKALNTYCFQRLFSVPPETQKNIINAIVWAFKHTERTISETGLEILDTLLNNVNNAPPEFAQNFYREYYLSILQDILYVLTDRLHKTSFSMHASILRHLFRIVAEGRVQAPLGQGAPNNEIFLKQYTSNMIAGAFPNVSKQDVEKFVIGLFDQNKDSAAFKAHIRDFLITIKEFSGDDNDQLFLQEKEEQARLQQEQQLRERAAIPGLLTQKEQDEMADL